jgi:uncharacterized membrane protein
MIPEDRPEPMRRVRTEILISTLLRVGVSLSAVLLVLGIVLTFVGHGSYLTSGKSLDHLTGASASFPHSLGSVIDGAVTGNGPSVVLIGLLVLVATPVVRVALSVLVFVLEHDRTFVAITLGVLSMLMLSFVLGKAGG